MNQASLKIWNEGIKMERPGDSDWRAGGEWEGHCCLSTVFALSLRRPGAVPSVWTLGGIHRISFMSRVMGSSCTGLLQRLKNTNTHTGYICITTPPSTHNAVMIKKSICLTERLINRLGMLIEMHCGLTFMWFNVPFVSCYFKWTNKTIQSNIRNYKYLINVGNWIKF